MPGGWEITISLVCPLIGVILSNVTILSPVPALLEARKKKKLGDLDPIPFALFVNSKLGWLIFSIFRIDYFIFFSAAPATLMGIVLCFTSIHLLERNDHLPVEETLRLVVEGIRPNPLKLPLFMASSSSFYYLKSEVRSTPFVQLVITSTIVRPLTSFHSRRTSHPKVFSSVVAPTGLSSSSSPPF